MMPGGGWAWGWVGGSNKGGISSGSDTRNLRFLLKTLPFLSWTKADLPNSSTLITTPLIVLAPVESSIRTLLFTFSSSGLGCVLNLGLSGPCALLATSFLARNCLCAAAAVSTGAVSTGVNQPTCRMGRLNQMRVGDNCPFCWGVSRYKDHEFSNGSICWGVMFGWVILTFRQRLRKILTEFSACPLLQAAPGLLSLWTMPVLSIHFFMSPWARMGSPSVANTRGHVLTWNHEVRTLETDFPVGACAK